MRAKTSGQGSSERQKAVKILARSLYKQLTSEGYDDKQIVALATELISEVTTAMASEHVARDTTPPPTIVSASR